METKHTHPAKEQSIQHGQHQMKQASKQAHTSYGRATWEGSSASDESSIKTKHIHPAKEQSIQHSQQQTNRASKQARTTCKRASHELSVEKSTYIPWAGNGLDVVSMW
jgi:hypothetical protein